MNFRFLFVPLVTMVSVYAGTFLSFDDPRSIAEKTNYALQHKLKGMMAWQIAQDKTGVLTQTMSKLLPGGKELVVYFPNYSVGQTRNYHIEDLQKLLWQGVNITSIVYCFVKPNGDGTVGFDNPELDFGKDGSEGNLEKLKKLKAKFPSVKLFLSVGGWAYKGAFFEALNNNNLKRLAFNCVALLPDFFDGIDIDWEFEMEGKNKEIEQFREHSVPFLNYVAQAAQVRNKKTWVTVALHPGVKFYQGQEKHLKEIAQEVDWINLMTYNYEGPGWSEITGHNAPLYSPDLPDKRRWKTTEPKFESVDTSIQAYLKAGVPPKKIVLGVAYYGRSYKRVKKGLDGNGLYEPHHGPAEDFKLVQPGSFDYANLIGKVPLSQAENKGHASGYQYHWDDVSKVPFLFKPQSS